MSCYSNGIWDKYDKSNSALNRNYLTDLVVDSSNNKWVVQLNNGLAMFNEETKIWKTYDTLNSALPDNGVLCITVDKEGLLWIGSRKGLSSFDGINWQTYNAENSDLPKSGVSKIAVDKNNYLWIISSEFDLHNRGDKLVKFDGNEFTIIDFAKDFPKLENKSFYAIWIDDLDRKWVSAFDELLWYENEKWNVMDRYATQIFFSCIGEIKSDGKDIVICSSMGGMIRYNGNKFMVQNRDNSFLPNDISTFALDKLGNKWIGTQSKGVILHNPNSIQYENKKKNKYPVILLVTIYWLISGTYINAQNNWLNFTNTDNVNDVVFQGDFVWVGTSGGLIKLNQITGEQIFYCRANSGLPANGISTLCFDNDDNLWVGTFNDGLAKFDGVNWQVFNEENSPLRYNSILTLTCDKNGILWIGTKMGLNRFINGNLVNDLEVQGILRFIEVADSGIVFLSFTNGIYSLSNNYQNWGERFCPQNDLGKLCEARSFLMKNSTEFWVGYENGFYHYHNKSWQKISNTSLGFENRMTVTAICFDKKNNLWVGSSSGSLSKYNGINAEVYNKKNSDFDGGSI